MQNLHSQTGMVRDTVSVRDSIWQFIGILGVSSVLILIAAIATASHGTHTPATSCSINREMKIGHTIRPIAKTSSCCDECAAMTPTRTGANNNTTLVLIRHRANSLPW